jgi:hypothetical protein
VVGVEVAAVVMVGIVVGTMGAIVVGDKDETTVAIEFPWRCAMNASNVNVAALLTARNESPVKERSMSSSRSGSTISWSGVGPWLRVESWSSTETARRTRSQSGSLTKGQD